MGSCVSPLTQAKILGAGAGIFGGFFLAASVVAAVALSVIFTPGLVVLGFTAGIAVTWTAIIGTPTAITFLVVAIVCFIKSRNLFLFLSSSTSTNAILSSSAEVSAQTATSSVQPSDTNKEEQLSDAKIYEIIFDGYKEARYKQLSEVKKHATKIKNHMVQSFGAGTAGAVDYRDISSMANFLDLYVVLRYLTLTDQIGYYAGIARNPEQLYVQMDINKVNTSSPRYGPQLVEESLVTKSHLMNA